MSTELTRIIESLVLPPGSLILLGLLGLIFFKRYLGKAFIFLSLLGFYLLSTPYISDSLMSGLEVYPALTIKQAKQSGAQAIVVLGAGRYMDAPEYGSDTVSTLHLVRLRYAAWLSHKTGLPVIPSGGAPIIEGIPEAQLAQKTLHDEFNVKVAAIEDASNNTRQNAQFTKAVLDDLGLDHVLLVTHAWHMPRAMEVMAKAGVNALPAPTAFRFKDDDVERVQDWLPSASAFLYSRLAIHEYVGRVWYRLTDNS